MEDNKNRPLRLSKGWPQPLNKGDRLVEVKITVIEEKQISDFFFFFFFFFNVFFFYFILFYFILFLFLFLFLFIFFLFSLKAQILE